MRKRSLALRAWFLNDLPVFSNASYQKRGCEDPKRGAQDPDPDDGALKIAPSDGGALGILCLGRGRHRSRPVRWGAEDLSAPAGTTQILAKKEALPRSRHTVSGAQDLRSQTGALKILTRKQRRKAA